MTRRLRAWVWDAIGLLILWAIGAAFAWGVANWIAEVPK